MQNTRRYMNNNFKGFQRNNYNRNYTRNNRTIMPRRFNQKDRSLPISTNRSNINRRNRYPNFRRNNIRNVQNKTNKEIKKLTQFIKTSALGGGPLKPLNSDITKNRNDPNNKKVKEIRYDRLYNALSMYYMGKYYSFYRTTNMIVRLPIYTTFSFVVQPGTDIASFVWYPYFYPYYPQIKVRAANENEYIDRVSNFIVRLGNSLYPYDVTGATIRGNYRLISATMKISNTTTNSNKGGSYTLYRVTRSETAPIYYNESLGYGNDAPIQAIRDLLGYIYSNEPCKYLYNANQMGIANEYGVIDGNTIFQGYNEYMGQRNPASTAFYAASAGSDSGGSGNNFNPQGVNVKYIGFIDTTSTAQTYKIECVQLFEVTPLSTDSLATLAYKGDKCALPQVISQAKNKFNFEIASP